MHDAGKILAGLVVFLAVATSPIWYHSATGAASAPPAFEIETKAQQCVAPTPYMRALHMDLLNEWRDAAVRDGDRLFVGVDGNTYEKSLTGTCLNNCHSNREEFCDRCHEYVGADPFCWDCHAEQGGMP